MSEGVDSDSNQVHPNGEVARGEEVKRDDGAKGIVAGEGWKER